METKKNVFKCFTARPGGTIKRGQAFKRHILTKKTTKNRRHLRSTEDIYETNLKSARVMIPYAQP